MVTNAPLRRSAGSTQTPDGMGSRVMADGDNDQIELDRERCKIGREKISELFRAHNKSLLRHCGQMLKDPFEAEDALQETFEIVSKAKVYANKKNNYSAWLMRIATNVCLNIKKANRRIGIDHTHLYEYEADPACDIERVEYYRQILGRFLVQLKPNEIATLKECFCQKSSQRQFATSCGISRRAVVKRVAKIREIAHFIWPMADRLRF